MRLIDADELKEEYKKLQKTAIEFEIAPKGILNLIDNAPTVEPPKQLVLRVRDDAELEQLKTAWGNGEICFSPIVAYTARPQGEWEESHICSCGKILRMRMDVIEHKCKNCGRWSIKWVGTIPDNFCSYCGAAMQNGGKEE